MTVVNREAGGIERGNKGRSKRRKHRRFISSPLSAFRWECGNAITAPAYYQREETNAAADEQSAEWKEPYVIIAFAHN